MVSALTIDDVRSAIAGRQTTATALARDFYTRIRQEDPEIGAFLTLCEERALAQAGRIDRWPPRASLCRRSREFRLRSKTSW